MAVCTGKAPTLTVVVRHFLRLLRLLRRLLQTLRQTSPTARKGSWSLARARWHSSCSLAWCDPCRRRRRHASHAAVPLPSRCPHAALTSPSRCCPRPGGLPSPRAVEGGCSEDQRLGGRRKAQGSRRCGTLDRPLTRARPRALTLSARHVLITVAPPALRAADLLRALDLHRVGPRGGRRVIQLRRVNQRGDGLAVVLLHRHGPQRGDDFARVD